MKTILKVLFLLIFCLFMFIETNAQIDVFYSAGRILANPTGLVDKIVGGRVDYYWEMADGTVAINRGVRGYRSAEYVYSSIYDETSGDCDTEVWQNGIRYANLCLGNAGGEGRDFVRRHGGVVRFYYHRR